MNRLGRGDVEHEGEAIAGRHGCIAGIGAEFQVGARNFGADDCVGTQAELEHQRRGCVALNVEILEEARRHFAAVVEQKSSGEGYAHHAGTGVDDRDELRCLLLDEGIVFAGGVNGHFGHGVQQAEALDYD